MASDDSAEHQFVQRAKQAAAPICTLDPTALDTSNLQLLQQAVGDARVVVLSEAFHNCKEFIELHHRVIRFPVEEMGFNTVAGETGFPEARAIHDYVLGSPTTDQMWDQGLTGMYSEWTEFRALIEWNS